MFEATNAYPVTMAYITSEVRASAKHLSIPKPMFYNVFSTLKKWSQQFLNHSISPALQHQVPVATLFFFFLIPELSEHSYFSCSLRATFFQSFCHIQSEDLSNSAHTINAQQE